MHSIIGREYFDDCEVGDQLTTPGRTITETDIVLFAQFTGDWTSVHVDAEYARRSVFGERIAHGMLTLVVGTALAFRLGEHALLPRSVIAVAGLDRIRFLEPVRVGDTLTMDSEIVEKKRMQNDRGVLGIRFKILNQHDEKVVQGRIRMLCGCRPEGGT